MENMGCSNSKEPRSQQTKAGCCCPYCDNPVEMSHPFCQACKVELVACKECNKIVSREDKICPNCGAAMK